jgi:YD repeat-containing protein
MQKFTNLTLSLLLLLYCLSSCKKNESEAPEQPLEILNPGDGANCALFKEYLEKDGKRTLSEQYEYDASDKLIKITHYDAEGKENIRRFEYDEKGRLAKIYEKLASGVPLVEYDGSVTFLYDSKDRVYKVDARKIVDGAETETQNRVIYYNDKEQVIRITSSFAQAWDFEYDADGNATKTYYTPNQKPKYLLEEYTSFDNKPQDKPLDKIFFLRNYLFAASGSSFSKNHVLAYKIYNEDGSLNQAYDITREYSTSGNPTKVITKTSGLTTTLLSDYKCK